jgi:hypothetical protein
MSEHEVAPYFILLAGKCPKIINCFWSKFFQKPSRAVDLRATMEFFIFTV